MQRDQFIEQLAHHREIFRAMFAAIPSDAIVWRSAPEKWCALEIVCHLFDEERDDFRYRLRSTLETPDRPWPKIDPLAWFVERKYMEQDFLAKLADFIHEREKSVAWLRSVSDGPWSNAYIHPKVGPVSCELLLTNWVAHDLHHIRQLNNLRYEHLRAHTTVPLDYAGKW